MPKQNNYQNQEQNRRLEWLENHFSTINAELNEVKIDIAKIKSDVCYLKKMNWFIITIIIGSFLANLIIK